nr:hypothetical protein [Tanacetum cinerariifolium]
MVLTYVGPRLGLTLLLQESPTPRVHAYYEHPIGDLSRLSPPTLLTTHPPSVPCSFSIGSSSGSFNIKKPVVVTQEPIMVEVSTQEPIVAEVIGQEDESTPTDRQFFYDDEGIDTAYETKYDVQSSEDACTDDDDDDDVDKDFLVDEENEIVEHDVDVHLFSISMDLPVYYIGVNNIGPDDVLEGEDMDVINADGFDSDPSNDEEKNYRKGRRNLNLYKNDGVRIRARCDGKMLVFTMSQGTRPTGLNHRMEAGPSGSSGPTTRSKKQKNIGTNDDNQASPSILATHDKGDLYPLVLEIKHYTYKFMYEKIFEQVRVNLDIPVKAVQDQLQRKLEVQISMSKAFRAKAKAERKIRRDHVL